MAYNNIVFIDTETTGLNPETCQIIELAAKVVGVSSTEMDCFIKLPDGELIPQKIVELTHITDDMLSEEGMSEETVARQFYEMISNGPTLLIAHNAQFDLCFIINMFKKFGLEIPSSVDFLDTLTVYKDKASLPHKLETAIGHYALADKCQNSHRAIDDCKALRLVFEAMLNERDDITHYINTFGYNPKYGIMGEKISKVRYLSQPYTNGLQPKPFCQ